MNEASFLSAIVGHLIGDYLLQSDYMALHKKESSFVCAWHCAIWSTCVVICASWPIWIWFLLFATHFIQDRTTIVETWMDVAGQKNFRTGPLAPWSVIVVDNVWHIVQLWVIWRFLPLD